MRAYLCAFGATPPQININQCNIYSKKIKNSGRSSHKAYQKVSLSLCRKALQQSLLEEYTILLADRRPSGRLEELILGLTQPSLAGTGTELGNNAFNFGPYIVNKGSFKNE